MPPEEPQKFAFFKDSEVVGLDEEFVRKLDLARKFAQIPFIITSGFRTPEKNQSVIGSVPDSSHLTGKAVDLKVENTHEVYLIVAAGLSVGITRFGIYTDSNNVPIHVHLDVDPDKVQEVIFPKREGQANTAPVTA